MDTVNLYQIYIIDRYRDLKINNIEITNFNLAKIFEWYSCIMLSQEYNQVFYNYDDIDGDYKEQHNLSRNDTGIDACNKDDTIVQCKLRQKQLTWSDCATFFASQNIYDEEEEKQLFVGIN